MTNVTSTALYICYFNVKEPLVQTQVLPYLRAVVASGVSLHLLTYERASWWRRSERRRRRMLKSELSAQGIEWHTLRYHKVPSLLATSYDVLAGLAVSLWLALRYRVRIVHARAHVPGVIGLALKWVIGVRLIFDLRGLMAEEYVDNGVWEEGSVPFCLVKAAERMLLKGADHIVVLTVKLRDQLNNGDRARVDPQKISVIPCCVDLAHYRSRPPRPQQELLKHLDVVYVGSVAGRYLLEQMADFFCVLRTKVGSARFLVITQSNRSGAERVLESRGVLRACYSVVASTPEGVSTLIENADIGLSFIRPTPALDGASPTKIGEYLAAGLAVVSSVGTGDTDDIITTERVGTIVREFTPSAYEVAAEHILEVVRDLDTPARCRAAAERHYSLRDVGEPRYQTVYRRLNGTPTGWEASS